MKGTEEYTPTLTEDGRHALVLVSVDRCPLCSRPMFRAGGVELCPLGGYWNGTAKQMERAGWALPIFVGGDHEWICSRCAAEDRAFFTCAICKDKRGLSQERDSFGTAKVCLTCYATMTAKAWNEKCVQLDEEHRWDFE